MSNTNLKTEDKSLQLLMSEAEALKYLGLSSDDRKLYELVFAGRVEGGEIGDHLYVTRASIDCYKWDIDHNFIGYSQDCALEQYALGSEYVAANKTLGDCWWDDNFKSTEFYGAFFDCCTTEEADAMYALLEDGELSTEEKDKEIDRLFEEVTRRVMECGSYSYEGKARVSERKSQT